MTDRAVQPRMAMKSRLQRWMVSSPTGLLLTSPHFIPKMLLRAAILPEASRLTGITVDLGCGYRPYSDGAGLSAIGIDLNNGVGPDITAEADAVPLADQSVDAVICTEVLEHTRAPQVVLAEITRILRPCGRAIISAPMEWNLHYEPHDYFRFTSYGLRSIVEGAGMEVTTVQRVGGVVSLIGARIVDVAWRVLARSRPSTLAQKARNVVVCLMLTPISLGFYLLSRLADGVDESDAIGWVALCTKAGNEDGEQ